MSINNYVWAIYHRPVCNSFRRAGWPCGIYNLPYTGITMSCLCQQGHWQEVISRGVTVMCAGACVCWFSKEFSWLRLLYRVSYFPGSANSRTRCWYIRRYIFRDTAVYDLWEDIFFRFSEWRIPEMMPFSPGYFREKWCLPGNRFRELDDVFAA